MLPFTKRPGRGDESGDHDLVDVASDDVAIAETVSPKAKGSTPVPRAKFNSFSDDEMTNIMPSKAIGDAVESALAASPRPAAGMPPPSSARAGLRTVPPPSRPSGASRSGKFAAMNDEEADGRTGVRGAPKIVKRAAGAPNSKMGQPTMPTTISPAAVIKATLESARVAQNKKTSEHLMAAPPQDLLEDLSDFRHSDRHPGGGPEQHTKILEAQAISHGSIPPSSGRPMSAPPPSMVGHTTNASGGYPVQQSGGYPAQQSGGFPAQQSGGFPAQQSGGYPYNGPVPSGSFSMQTSVPAHFMVPQAPHSDGRMDPPGTAVTARTKVVGRPAMSWAMALMAFGLFVGVGAFAVMRGNVDGLMETSASFVDPARAGAHKAVGAEAAPVTPTPVPVVPEQQPSIVGVPGVAVPVAVTAPVVAAATAPVRAIAPPPPTVAVAPVAPPQAGVAPPPVPKVHVSRPVVRPPPAAEEPVAVAPPPAPKPGKVKPPAAGAKPAGDPAVDEEQKKALKQLQESQLESTF